MASYSSVAEMFRARVKDTPNHVAFKAPRADDSWEDITWREVDEKVRAVAGGLRALGMESGSRASLLCSTRVDWLIIDVAINCAGGATTTIYPSSTVEDTQFIADNSGSSFVFAEDESQTAKLLEKRNDLKKIERVIQIEGDTVDDEWVISLAELMSMGTDWNNENDGALDEVIDNIKPSDLATLIYTSGTTGQPKGVILSHDCWLYIGEALDETGFLGKTDVQYLWLPLSHSFGKMLEVALISQGITTAVDGRIPKIVDNLSVIRPTFMAAAPRIFEKVYNKVIQGAQQAGGAKLAIFKWATEVGRTVSKLRQNGKEPSGFLRLQFKIADKLVFSKLRDKFGGRIRFFISGSAPLNRDIAEFFHAAGLLILEGYGLTESSAASFVNRPDQNKFGTVGQPMPGTELKIADDGEILIKSRGIMGGYYNLPDVTTETLVDGWLHTGDIGEVDADGHLRITDRKKNLIKTSGGKYVAPQALEGGFKAICPFVSQILVHGDRRNFCSALVTLDEEAIAAWAQENGLNGSYAEITQSSAVQGMMQTYFDNLNEGLARFETIKKFAVLPEDFTVENAMLTPSLKVKRKAVENHYADLLDGFYSESMAEL